MAARQSGKPLHFKGALKIKKVPLDGMGDGYFVFKSKAITGIEAVGASDSVVIGRGTFVVGRGASRVTYQNVNIRAEVSGDSPEAATSFDIRIDQPVENPIHISGILSKGTFVASDEVLK